MHTQIFLMFGLLISFSFLFLTVQSGAEVAANGGKDQRTGDHAVKGRQHYEILSSSGQTDGYSENVNPAIVSVRTHVN